MDSPVKKPPLIRIVPELNGLRGIGVSLVVLGHVLGARYFFLAPTLLDLFFIYSALFITLIFLKSTTTVKNIKTFYLRRALRIWPLYFVIMPACLILEEISHVTGIGPGKHHSLLEVLQFFTFTQFASFYLTKYAVNTEFLLPHTWSLAVEEQFYTIWPFLVVILLRAPKVGAAILVAMPACAFGAREYGLSSYLLLPRLDNFVLGTLIAVTIHRPVLRWRDVEISARNIWCGVALGLGLMCLALGILTFMGQPSDGPIQVIGFDDAPQIALIFKLFYASLLATIMLTSKAMVWAPLRAKILIGLGEMAYPIYLIHMPVVLIVGSATQRDWGITLAQSGLISVPITLIASYLWTQHVDKRIDAWRNRASYQAAAGPAAGNPQTP